jgi:hypothetical protein
MHNISSWAITVLPQTIAALLVLIAGSWLARWGERRLTGCASSIPLSPVVSLPSFATRPCFWVPSHTRADHEQLEPLVEVLCHGFSVFPQLRAPSYEHWYIALAQRRGAET